MNWTTNILDAPIKKDLTRGEGLKNTLNNLKELGSTAREKSATIFKVLGYVLGAIIVMSGAVATVSFIGYSGKWVLDFGLGTMDKIMTTNPVLVIGVLAGIGLVAIVGLLVDQVDWNSQKTQKEPSRRLNGITEAISDGSKAVLGRLLGFAVVGLGIVGMSTIFFSVSAFMDGIASDKQAVVVGILLVVGIVFSIVVGISSLFSKSDSSSTS